MYVSYVHVSGAMGWCLLLWERVSLITSHGRVAGYTLNQGGKDGTDTNTSTGKTNGGETGTLHLGSSNEGHCCGLDDDAAGLHGIAGDGRGQAGPGCVIEEQAAMTSSGLTRLANDRTRDTS